MKFPVVFGATYERRIVVDGAAVVNQLAEIPLTAHRWGTDQAARSTLGGAPRPSSFFAGPENQLVATAVERLLPSSESMAQTGRPTLFLMWGASGTGKTHLACGICQLWQERFGEAAALYLTAADFRRELAAAIDSEAVADWRGRVRSPRLLVLDDIHRLPADTYLDEELLHLLDTRAASGLLVLATCKGPPSAASTLSPAVIDRLSGGLVLSIAAAGLEARTEFARQFATQLGRPISQETATLIAERTAGGLNELANLVAELIHGIDPPSSLTREGIARYLDDLATQRRPMFSDILRVVAKYYSIPQKVIKGSSRRQSVVTARAMLVYLARRMAGLSYQQIGRGLSGRDHTTIMHSYRKTQTSAEHDLATQQAINDLERLLSVP